MVSVFIDTEDDRSYVLGCFLINSLKGGRKKVDFLGDVSPIQGGGPGIDPHPAKKKYFACPEIIYY